MRNPVDTCLPVELGPNTGEERKVEESEEVKTHQEPDVDVCAY